MDSSNLARLQIPTWKSVRYQMNCRHPDVRFLTATPQNTPNRTADSNQPRKILPRIFQLGHRRLRQITGQRHIFREYGLNVLH